MTESRWVLVLAGSGAVLHVLNPSSPAGEWRSLCGRPGMCRAAGYGTYERPRITLCPSCRATADAVNVQEALGLAGPQWPAGLDVETDMLGYSTAVFSPDRAYRYALTREWDSALPPAVWIMLNPSTADAFKDDQTIRRCISYSKREGAGGLVVVNLFALRCTDPNVMKAHPAPVGEMNDQVIRHVRAMTGWRSLWFVAWGTHGVHLGRDAAVGELLHELQVKPICLGNLTLNGQPRHPSRLSNDVELLSW